MTITPKVKVLISLIDDNLNDDELEEVIQKLVQEMREFDELDKVGQVIDLNIPENAKPIGSFVIGLLQAEVSLENFKKLTSFLSDRIGNGRIKMEAEVNGSKFKIEASSREELKAGVEAAKDFFASVKNNG